MSAMRWLHKILSRDKPRIPQSLWQQCVERLPFLQRLAADDLDRLKLLSETLLDKKTFTGAGGLEMTDEVAVMIAAQASLPVLNLTLDLYDDMAGIIVYPSEFIVPRAELDEAGVMHEWQAPVSGEALDMGGAVVLSWEDIDAIDEPGYNVVIHEFAHKIDMRGGAPNGHPPFLTAYHEGMNPAEWQEVFSAAYKDFSERVDDLDNRLPDEADGADDEAAHEALYVALPLDPYAAENPAEFFAVASEAFFALPAPLAAAYPEVFRLLGRYYLQAPLGPA
jgi:Mlc titration factor MtfA (ptsG expression regulator)